MARMSQPPTEKAHQIIARTAMFVSKHGGQSEIILRVKQGDNPTFGFLMPDHHLHIYFRFLVEHPELLHSEFDGNSQNEHQKAGSQQNDMKGVGGALSLLGSVYDSGEEEEEGDDTAKTEKYIFLNNPSSVDRNASQGAKDIEAHKDPAKGESVSKHSVLSSKEKIITVKKNSFINASKSGSVKSREDKSHLAAAATADKAKKLAARTSKIEPLVLQPPPELRKLIDKIVEFIMRNGRQFEATLIEQDSKHGRFPFLLPSDQNHSFYLKVLETAQETKKNGASSYPGKDDRKASLLKDKNIQPLDSTFCDMPQEYDRKEKFKMVIGKSKKESPETESKEIHECGITVDAAAAAAILQAATRGIKRTSQSAHGVNGSEDGHRGDLGRSPPSQTDTAVEKSSCIEAAGEADSSEAHVTKEQKLKAERLKRAKMFVAMLKTGTVPAPKPGTSHGTSLEPLESGVSKSAGSLNLDGKESEGNLAPADVGSPAAGENPPANYFGEEHTDRGLSKRKYRSRADRCENDDEGDDGHNERCSRKKLRSRSRRHDENENSVEMQQKHHRRRNRTHSSSEENEDGIGSSEYRRDRKNHKLKHRSHHSEEEDEFEDRYKEDTNNRRKHRSHDSPEHSRKRRPEEYVQEDDENERGKRKSRRKHNSSHHDRDKHRHKSRRSSRDKESRHNRKHDTSSDDDHKHRRVNENRKGLYEERDELEEGEISSKVSEESQRVTSGRISREASVDAASFQKRTPSQPCDAAAEVPDDLRAKIRAMLMETL